MRPQFLNSITDRNKKEYFLVYATISIILFFVCLINLLADLFDYTIKLIAVSVVTLFFILLSPYDLYRFAKKLFGYQ